MIEQIYRLEAQHQRRISVLLERRGGEHRGFETVNGACPNDAAESAHGVASGFSIVGEIVQPALNARRRAKLVDETPLCCCEGELGWVDPDCIGERRGFHVPEN